MVLARRICGRFSFWDICCWPIRSRSTGVVCFTGTDAKVRFNGDCDIMLTHATLTYHYCIAFPNARPPDESILSERQPAPFPTRRACATVSKPRLETSERRGGRWRRTRGASDGILSVCFCLALCLIFCLCFALVCFLALQWYCLVDMTAFTYVWTFICFRCIENHGGGVTWNVYPDSRGNWQQLMVLVV